MTKDDTVFYKMSLHYNLFGTNTSSAMWKNDYDTARCGTSFRLCLAEDGEQTHADNTLISHST